MFQMQSWHEGEGWTPMDGPGRPPVWKPRKTLLEAARKCIEWTGLIAIPAMQVVDLDSGTVVWRDSEQYPDAGEPILPEWDAQLRAEVRAAFRREAELEAAAPVEQQGTFDLDGLGAP